MSFSPIGRRSANDETPEGTHLCEPLPQTFPRQIREIPLSVRVSLTLTEGNCLYRDFFCDFAVTSVPAALESLVRNPSTWLVYEFFIDGAKPAYRAEVDWPLLRRGRESDCRARRLVVEGILPVWESDPVLFALRREPVYPCDSRLRLRAGGMDQSDAIRRWEQLASAMRPIVRRLKSTEDFTCL